jgi:hypothetical protein
MHDTRYMMHALFTCPAQHAMEGQHTPISRSSSAETHQEPIATGAHAFSSHMATRSFLRNLPKLAVTQSTRGSSPSCGKTSALDPNVVIRPGAVRPPLHTWVMTIPGMKRSVARSFFPSPACTVTAGIICGATCSMYSDGCARTPAPASSVVNHSGVLPCKYRQTCMGANHAARMGVLCGNDGPAGHSNGHTLSGSLCSVICAPFGHSSSS